MPLIKTRSNDNGEEYKNRAIFDRKTILLVLALIGGNTGFNLATNDKDTKIELLEQRFETYCESQKDQDKLKMRMIQKEFEHINETLDKIEEMLKDLK